ncbi:hypothetical protein WB66_11140 [bacteria symbiont BFo1 of Frankliniella occidentalis]|nr:hypothetical protein WB66_11140 [bacteria symbiont BFo1 of Frankliniella occidentalis]
MPIEEFSDLTGTPLEDVRVLFGAANVLDDLIDQLESAERERDELRAEQAEHDEQIARMESKFSLAKRALDSKTARCEKAEAELRRRDAAAGEPVALRWRFIPMYSDVPFMHWTYIDNPKFFPDIRAMEGAEIQEVFSVAPPAVLPSEKVSLNNGVIGFDEGYNQCLSDALALGAQQQKVVELPEPVKWPEVPFKYFSEEQVFSMLDAAGVKWEVKK